MRFFPSLDRKTPDAHVERKQTSPLATWQQNRPYKSSWDPERAVRDGMSKVTTVFACVEALANDQAELPIILRDGHPSNGPEIERHDLLPLLNFQSSPDESAWVFRHRLSASLLLSKRGTFIEVTRTRLGQVVKLELLPVGYTWPIPGSGGKFLAGFEVNVPGGAKRRLRPEDVIWIRDPHPTNPYEGMTPLEACGLTVDNNRLAKLYQRHFLENDGRPGSILAIQGETSDDDLQEVKARLGSGVSGAGRVAVISDYLVQPDGSKTPGGGISFIDTSATPRDAQYPELVRLADDEILMAFGVPKTRIGDSSGRTFANAESEENVYERRRLTNHLNLVARGGLDDLDGDPAVFVGFDRSGSAVWQRDEERRRKSLLEELKLGTITRDEYREATGRDPLAEGGGVVYIANNLVPLGSPSRPTPGPPAGGGGKTRKAAEPDAPVEPEDAIDWGPWRVSSKRLDRARAEHDRRLRTWEKTMARTMRALFARQESLTLERLVSAKALRGTRHWVGPKQDHAGLGTKAIGADDVFDLEKWDEQIVEDGIAVLTEVLTDFGEDVLDRLQDATKDAGPTESKDDTTVAVAFDVSDPRVTAFLKDRANRLKGVNETTWSAIRDTLAEGEADGDTIADLSKRIRSVFSDASTSRAETIARTEVVSASNDGAYEGARQSGVAATKGWLATLDQRTRDAHSTIDGTFVGIDEKFVVGGEEMLYPGDPGASAANTIRCRCTVIFGTDSEVIL